MRTTTGARTGNVVEVPLDIAVALDEQVSQVLRRARDAGQPVAPPILAMGVFERVGSNWFTTRLRPNVTVYNEPFRQQLHASHPLSTRNPDPAQGEGAWRAPGAREFAAHWLTAFAVSKYDVSPVLLKETNLYFSTGAFMRLFPDSDVVLLSRNLVGTINSFQKGDLFTRWRYQDRYHQVARTASNLAAGRRWVDLVPDRAMSRTEMLVRLVVLNTALLVEATASRRCLHLPYEEAVTSPDASRARLQAFAPLVAGAAPGPSSRSPKPGVVDATFSPHESRTSLRVSLDRHEVTQIETMLAESLGILRCLVAPQHLDMVRDLLAGTAHGRYAPTPAATTPLRPSKVGPAVERHSRATLPKPRFVATPAAGSTGAVVRWRDQLVTNREYCAFLNTLRSAGAANVVGGVHLLFNESMIPERGGRIVYDDHAIAHRDEARGGAYRVVPGHEDHAVSWVTWLGAALFARHTGSRLPRRAEFLDLLALTQRQADGLNVDFRVGDTTPVLEDNLDAECVHHVRGNVQVWCEDGPPDGPMPSVVARRYFCGAAWNTTGDDADLTRHKARHITGSSRSIGIRLVRDITEPVIPLPIETITRRLTTGLARLGAPGRDLRELDEALARLVYKATP